MAEHKLDLQYIFDDAVKISNNRIYTKHFGKPQFSHFDDLQSQRKSQRFILFWFAIISSSASLIGLGYLLYLQANIRISGNYEFKILNGYELEILSVAIFGQIVAIIHLITKSLWNEEPFKEILKEDHKNNHK